MIAAAGSLAPVAAAQAAVTPDEVGRAMNARSFSELLGSVPNASAILRAVDEQRTETTTQGDVQLAYHHHHHHHHWWHHHHHHHHHCWWHYHHHYCGW
jgi:hypothetical protein